MTADEAHHILENKMRRTFDGYSCRMSKADAEAVRVLLRENRQVKFWRSLCIERGIVKEEVKA